MTSIQRARTIPGSFYGRAAARQVLVLAGGELALFIAYQADNGPRRWLMSLLVGVSAAALVHLVAFAALRAPAPAPIVSILIAHAIVALPDAMEGFGVPHRPWMDVFLGHLSVESARGDASGLLVLALLASLTYCCVLALWLRGARATGRFTLHSRHQ